MSEPRVLNREPSALPLMLKAALPAIPGVSLLPGIKKSGSTLPDLALTRHDISIDLDRVAAYNDVCGFSRKDTVPITYPHMLAFPLHMAIMTDATFPFPAIGTVHVENSITQHRGISAQEKLQVTASPQNLRPHPKGRAFDIVTHVHSGGELVWEETTTLLRRGRSNETGAVDPEKGFEVATPSVIEWNLRGDLGRRYAAVSGDHNPIHLYAITAKAFGFPRQIVHGMWSKARCLAALEGRLPDAVTVDVTFKKAILLPGSVAFSASRADTGIGTGQGSYAFELISPKTGAPHLRGGTTPL